MNEKKLAFLFGTQPEDANLDDVETRERLIAEEVSALGLPDKQARVAQMMRRAIVTQVLDDNPPAVWQTVERLASMDMDRTLIWTMLQHALARTLKENLGQETGTQDEEMYVDLLEALPPQSTQIVANTLLDLVRQHQPIPAEDLDNMVAKELGLSVDSEACQALLDNAFADLFDPEGPLYFLGDDRVVEISSFTEGITLTHRVNDFELRIGVLTIAFDLAPFGRADKLVLSGTEEVETFSADPGHLAWHGPDGWLDSYEAGDLLAVRVEGGRVKIDRTATEPEMGDELVAAARFAYDQEMSHSGGEALPVPGIDIVLNMIANDRAIFSTPRPPLDEICAAAGLDRRQDRVAHDPGAWENQRRLDRIRRMNVALERKDQRRAAARCLDAFDDDALPDGDVRAALSGLRDRDVLDAVVTELLADLDERGDISTHARNVVTRCLDLASKPAHVAVARMLAARLDEADHDVIAAEAQLHLAIEADPDWAPALDRLAWYLSDRGDAVAAARLWRRAGIAVDGPGGQHLSEVEQFTHTGTGDVGRNDPCWCGAGRKFKHCHFGQPARVPLPDRVGWLCHKAVSYLERSGDEAQETMLEMVDHRATDPEDRDSIVEAISDPLVIDVVLHELGWFRRFLADRGPLLPDDEAILAEAWMLVDRTVYEVTDVRPGKRVTIRDIRTGDRVEVRERTFSREARPGMFVCARAVPDGESHQFIGGIFPVRPGSEVHVLDILDNEGPEELLAYVASTHRMPHMVTRENEPIVLCDATIDVPDADAAAVFLNERYGPKGEAGWVELFDLNEDESIARAGITLDGTKIHVSTTSEPRIERTTAALCAGIKGARVVADERKPFDPKRDGAALVKATDSEDSDTPLDPAVIVQIQETMERRWLGENIPALGGLTPREAADDPTRRDELRRLIDSFDAPFGGSGVFGMRPAELRRALGIE